MQIIKQLLRDVTEFFCVKIPQEVVEQRGSASGAAMVSEQASGAGISQRGGHGVSVLHSVRHRNFPRDVCDASCHNTQVSSSATGN